MQPSAPPTSRPAAWSGLDISKPTFDGSLYLPHEPTSPPREVMSLKKETFERSPKGVAQWLAWCDRQLAAYAKDHGLDRPPALRVCLDATGSYSLELLPWLVAARQGLEPAVVDPLAAHHYAKSLRMRNKTDGIDARVLSRMGYERRFVATPPLAEPYATLRQITRERDFLMGQLQSAGLRAQELKDQPRLLEIQQSFIKGIKKAVRDVDRLLNKHVASHKELAADVRRLRTIPGVGRLTAVVILAELGDLRRFAKSRQMTSFAGLNPKLFESGTSVQYEAHLSKQGPARARKVLYMSAMSVLRCESPLHQFYEHLLEQHKCKMSALGALMRKQLVLMRAVLVGRCDYDPEYVKIPGAAPSAVTCG